MSRSAARASTASQRERRADPAGRTVPTVPTEKEKEPRAEPGAAPLRASLEPATSELVPPELAPPESVVGEAAAIERAPADLALATPAATGAVSDLMAAAPPADAPSGETPEDLSAQGTAGQEPDAIAADLLEASAAADDRPEVASPVNYDDEGLGEVLIEDRIYRFDSGKQGSALCLSARQEGVWQWSYLGELRWDGRDLRSKQLDRRLLTQLSESLRQLASASS